MLAAHDDFFEAPEKVSLTWFREEIRKNLFDGAVLNGEVIRLELVFDKEVAGVNAIWIRSARLLSVLLESDGALVVLVENVADDCVDPCLSMNFRFQIAYVR